MIKKYERINFQTNVSNSFMLFDNILKIEKDIFKSNCVIHCHNNDCKYKNLIIGETEVDYDGIICQFLKKILQYTKKFDNDIFFDITIRGAGFLDDVLIDLIRVNNSSAQLPKELHKNFSSWVDPFAPNSFSLSIENSDYIESILKLMIKGSITIKNQLPQEVSHFPRIFIIDIIKLDNKNPEICDAVRWTYVDIPCGPNANVGNKLIKFLQNDPTQAEIKLQAIKEPIIAGIKDFLRKDTFSTVIYNFNDYEYFKNFENINKVLSKWCIFPRKPIKLNTEEYLSGTSSDVEYLKTFEYENNFSEILPVIESKRMEYEESVLKKINNSILYNIDDVKNKIEKVKEKVLINEKTIIKHEKINDLFQKQIEKIKNNCFISKEKNLKLNKDFENLKNEKYFISNDILDKEKKNKDLQSKIDKLNYLNYTLEKELQEKERSNVKVSLEVEKLFTIGCNMYKKFKKELELISETNFSIKRNYDNNKKMLSNNYKIFELQTILQNFSNIFTEFMEIEKKNENNITELNLYQDAIKLDEEIILKKLNQISF